MRGKKRVNSKDLEMSLVLEREHRCTGCKSCHLKEGRPPLGHKTTGGGKECEGPREKDDGSRVTRGGDSKLQIRHFSAKKAVRERRNTWPKDGAKKGKSVAQRK